jgi:hypothetical protein
MLKQTKVILLPTEKEGVIAKGSRLFYIGDRPIWKEKVPDGSWTHQHLYFLSDEPIKDGEILPYIMCWTDGSFELFNSNNRISESRRLSGLAKKVIATTDILNIHPMQMNSPHYDHLPQPSKSFIEKYITEYNKSNIIKEVMVEYEEKTFEEHWYCEQTGERNFDITPPIGKIWIRYWAHKDIYHILKVAKDNTITIRPIKDSWTREEVINLIRNAMQSKGYTPEYEVIEFCKENL